MTSALAAHFHSLLSSRPPPKTFCPSEVARKLTQADLEALSVERGEALQHWRDAMPAVRAWAWEARARGECEILQRGVVLGREVGIGDVRGPVRLRRGEGKGEEERQDEEREEGEIGR
jgi:hypothetical protein